MLRARWSLDAQFGYKQDLTDMMQRWLREIGPQAGFGCERSRLLTGSIGAREAALRWAHLAENLAELDRAWENPGTIAAHRRWSKDLDPHVVSGASRRESFRVL